jgi:hypothetical protein
MFVESHSVNSISEEMWFKTENRLDKSNSGISTPTKCLQIPTQVTLLRVNCLCLYQRLLADYQTDTEWWSGYYSGLPKLELPLFRCRIGSYFEIFSKE